MGEPITRQQGGVSIDPDCEHPMLKSLGKSFEIKTDKNGKTKVIRVHRFRDASHAVAAKKSKRQRVVRRAV
jgi:hypothetical protein